MLARWRGQADAGLVVGFCVTNLLGVYSKTSRDVYGAINLADRYKNLHSVSHIEDLVHLFIWGA